MDLLFPQIEFDNNTWLDQRLEANENLRLWHVGLMGFGVFLSVGKKGHYFLICNDFKL